MTECNTHTHIQHSAWHLACTSTTTADSLSITKPLRMTTLNDFQLPPGRVQFSFIWYAVFQVFLFYIFRSNLPQMQTFLKERKKERKRKKEENSYTIRMGFVFLFFFCSTGV
jgi:hypothetical protein